MSLKCLNFNCESWKHQQVLSTSRRKALVEAFHLLCDCETSIFVKDRLKLQTRCPLVYGSCAWWGGEHNISKCLAYYNYNSQPSSFVTLHGFYSVHAWNLEISTWRIEKLNLNLKEIISQVMWSQQNMITFLHRIQGELEVFVTVLLKVYHLDKLDII